MGSIRKSSRDTPQDLDVELSNYIADIDDIIRKDSTASGGGGGGEEGGRSGRTSAGKVVVWPPADSRVTTPELVTPPPTYAPLARLERHNLGLLDAEEEDVEAVAKQSGDVGAAEIYEEAIRYNRSQTAHEQGPHHRGGASAVVQNSQTASNSNSSQIIQQNSASFSKIIQQSSMSTSKTVQQSSMSSSKTVQQSSMSSSKTIQQSSISSSSQSSQMLQHSNKLTGNSQVSAGTLW